MIAFSLPGLSRVACVGAHPDDIEIGCGGTLLTLARRAGTEVEVSCLVLSGTSDREAESRSALAKIAPGVTTRFGEVPDGRFPSHWEAVKRALEDFRTDIGDPDVVFLPRFDDAHQDHRLLGKLGSTVWRDSLLLHYEIPKWDGDLRPLNQYVEITPEIAREKVAILNQSFPSQLSRDWWDDEFFLGLMRVRGAEIRSRYAEAFDCRKSSVNF